MTSEDSNGLRDPQDLGQLKELIAFLKENEIAEFDLERGDLKVRLKFASAVVAPAAGQVDLAALAQLMGSGAAGPGSGLGAVHAAGHSGLGAGAAALPGAGSGASGPGGATAAREASVEEELHIVKSPIVGTFYESPSPGSSAFVSSGDRIEKGQVICIVEAMKLMNEIESDAAGEIVKRLVNNGQPVEYGQPLFAVRVS